MENNNTEKKESFFEKVKNALIKFFKGVKNFFIKTGRVNGSHCYGIIQGIGDFLVYDDHALISAVGMDDVTFTKENVVSYYFDGLGNIRRNKATVKYKITLDDNVVFPEKVREKNDVKNITAVINVEKDSTHLWGRGTAEYGKSANKLSPIEECDVYGYGDCFVIVLKLERRNGDKIEKYQESMLYPFSDIKALYDGSTTPSGKPVVVEFKDGKTMSFTVRNETVYATVKSIEIK
jgi:hypothetical protein